MDLISRQKTIKTICFYFEDLIIALPKIVDSDGEKTVDISKINEYLEMYKAIRELIATLPSEDYEDIWEKGYDVGYSMGKEDGRADALQEVFDKFAVEVRKI